ncbi:TlpA family protein disulfide reductase [Aquimarina rhabdastrellae]
MKLDKNKISNIVFAIFIVLFLIPNTRGLMQIFLTRIFSFSPSVVAVEDRTKIEGYHWKLHGVNTPSINFKETEGKVILINYWATWCPPCIAEMPSLQKVYNDYKDEVVFLFVTTDDDPELNKFMNDKKYDFPIYRALTSAPKPLNGKSLPTTYVIDKEGTIIVDKIGAADWNSSSTRELLDKLIKE